jgi:putative tryptophan/tyrosine transport system substrate-binding protein
MRRRKLVIAIGLGALAPLGALGQSALDTGRPAAFVKGMRELGYAEGKDYTLEERYADGKMERVTGIAAELVQAKVDVIVVFGTPSTRAAQKATATIPIVTAGVADAVADGFAKTLARPEGNVTGFSVPTGELTQKYFELLQDMVPKLSRVGVLMNPGNSAHTAQLKGVQAAAQKVQIQTFAADAPDTAGIEAGIAAFARESVGAIIILPDTFFVQQAKQLAQLALKHRLPSVYLTREYPEAGGMMSYGPNVTDNFRRVAGYVDRIFKGAKPGDLPFEQPATFELVINLKVAKAVGISIPPHIAFRADRLIE